MALSEENYREIIRESKKLVPGFKYTSNLRSKARTDYFEVDGLYLVDENLICFHKPKKYKSKAHFARIVYHEIAHWCMQHKNTKFTFKRKFSKALVRDVLEEIIADLVAREICLELGYLDTKDKFDVNHIEKYKRDFKELEEELKEEYPEEYENYYKEGTQYAREFSKKIVEYILRS